MYFYLIGLNLSPFMVEGVLYAVLGTIITLLLLIPITRIASPVVAKFFEHQFDLYTYYIQHLSWLGLYEIIGMSILTIIASTIAIHKYLKV